MIAIQCMNSIVVTSCTCSSQLHRVNSLVGLGAVLATMQMMGTCTKKGGMVKTLAQLVLKVI